MSTKPSSSSLHAGIRPANAPPLETLGARIRYMRTVLAISQTELAKRAKITQPVISELESGKAQTSGHTASIAHALGVNAYWLETGRDEMPQFEGDALDEQVVIPMISAPGNCSGRW